jgi:hypothetical protein
MAVMWPRTLPPDVVGNALRSTECEVFRRLEAVLDDAFVVFYSRPWLGLKPDGEEIDGECDFVVAHATLGMLTLEVKGDAVACDKRTGQWTSRDRWNVTHNIKNPVQQARSAKHELLGKLIASPHWKARRIRARHGVVLPIRLRRPAIWAPICRNAFSVSLEDSNTGFETGFWNDSAMRREMRDAQRTWGGTAFRRWRKSLPGLFSLERRLALCCRVTMRRYKR